MKGEVPYVSLQRKKYSFYKRNLWTYGILNGNHEILCIMKQIYIGVWQQKYKIVRLLLQVPIHTKTFRYVIALYVHSAPY